MERASIIGLDLAKQVFQVHGMSKDGRKAFSRRLERAELHAFFKKQKACIVAMEATSGSHFWGREIEKLGHTPRLIHAQYVKPFVKRQKSDALDAEAIAVAAAQAGMRFVPIKSTEQQAIITLMRARTLFIRQRTSSINALRGLLGEFGFVVPSRTTNIVKLAQLLDAEEKRVPEPARTVLRDVYQHIEAINRRIAHMERLIDEQIKLDTAVQRLITIPGVGKITAATICASVSDPTLFKSARHFSSWLGITPRSFSSGGKQIFGRISKRGNAEIRKLLVLGAFPVVSAARRNGSPQPWLESLVQRKPYKVAAVAVANKTARIAWALLAKGGEYQSKRRGLDQAPL